jgi:hypothetical protein
MTDELPRLQAVFSGRFRFGREPGRGMAFALLGGNLRQRRPDTIEVHDTAPAMNTVTIAERPGGHGKDD